MDQETQKDKMQMNTESSKVTTLTVLIVILTAVVSGGGVYLWMNKEIQDLKEQVELNILSGEQEETYNFGEKQYDETENILDKSFDPPYELTWKENNRAQISLTGAALGDIGIEKLSSLKNPYGDSSLEIGDRIRVLILKFKVSTVGFTDQEEECLSFSLRRGTIDGDFILPISKPLMYEWSQGHNVCWPNDNSTHLDKEIIFAVPESEKHFTLATPSEDRVSFTISFENPDDIRVVDKHFPPQ